jgi:hypothetical protein
MSAAITEHRVVKIDGKRDLEAIKGKEAGYLVSIFNRDLALMRINFFAAACSSIPADWIRNTNGPALPSMIGTSLALTST